MLVRVFNSIEENRLTKHSKTKKGEKKKATETLILVLLIVSRVLHQEHQVSPDIL